MDHVGDLNSNDERAVWKWCDDLLSVCTKCHITIDLLAINIQGIYVISTCRYRRSFPRYLRTKKSYCSQVSKEFFKLASKDRACKIYIYTLRAVLKNNFVEFENSIKV